MPVGRATCLVFPAEITVAVEVEVLAYTPAEPGRYGDRPERCWPAEPEAVEVAVRLGGREVTDALPVAIRDLLEAEARERIRDAAAEARLP
jgi:hypothetical protein